MHVVTRSTAVAALFALGTQLSFAQTAPRAEEIFARHVAAVGGKDAILKLSSVKTTGTMQVVSMGLTAAVETYLAAPNRVAMRITIPGIGDIASGYDGTTAWEVNPMQGPRIKSDKEKMTTQEEADFYGSMLFSKERFTSAETVGPTQFGGEKAWQVKTVLKSGRVVNEYFSIATGLRIGSQTTQESPSGTLDVTTVESSYKQFGGLMMPTKTEMSTGATKMVLTVTDIAFGELPSSTFALPPQIKALVSRN